MFDNAKRRRDSLLPGALTALLACLLLTGCTREAAPERERVARPVKLFRVDGSLGEELRRFPATIEASQRAELSFRVAGRLMELSLREGDIVQKGQVIARLDPTDFRIALEDRQASFDNASRNFERAQQLVNDGNISRLDFDRMEAEFRSARAALAQARTNLGYTELKAPFTGRIARRLVENFEEVQAMQVIGRLQDTDELDVIIALPESVVRSVSQPARGDLESTDAADSRASQVHARISFQDYEGLSYALRLKEAATRADPDTQTFRVTFAMPQPDEFTLLPGMTAEVELDFTGLLRDAPVTWVPAQAVQADAALAPRVWVLDGEAMAVRSRPVETGRLAGNMIEITSGLSGGEELVSAGAAYLSEGMAVTRLETGEQAVPREQMGSDAP
jgi:RND family efflux transporter MFP subunit